MRWRIRYQLLLPLLTLLLGVVGVSAWTAVASAGRARQQIEARLRDVGGALGEERTYPLTHPVLAQVQQLSGADFLLESPDGARLDGTLGDGPVAQPPADAVSDDWRDSRLGRPSRSAAACTCAAGCASATSRIAATFCIFSIPKHCGATRCGRRSGLPWFSAGPWAWRRWAWRWAWVSG